MQHSNASVATLVSEHHTLLKDMAITSGVLDLACGSGRNGLFLLEHNIPVTFADNNASALNEVEKRGKQFSHLMQNWLIDFERPGEKPLANKTFDAVLVFNYLHRPLWQQIREAVRPGGLVFYETFTEQQRNYGRPSNPDFLLKEQELREEFSSWKILHYWEGEKENPQRAMASLIARKP